MHANCLGKPPWPKQQHTWLKLIDYHRSHQQLLAVSKAQQYIYINKTFSCRLKTSMCLKNWNILACENSHYLTSLGIETSDLRAPIVRQHTNIVKLAKRMCVFRSYRSKKRGENAGRRFCWGFHRETCMGTEKMIVLLDAAADCISHSLFARCLLFTWNIWKEAARMKCPSEISSAFLSACNYFVMHSHKQLVLHWLYRGNCWLIRWRW